MDTRAKLIQDLSEFIADKLLELEKEGILPILPLNEVHLERAMMSLEASGFGLSYRVSDSHGYTIFFESLPENEQIQGAIGVFVLKILYKDPLSGEFISGVEKRVYLFPSQVTEAIREESLALYDRAPTYYKLINESQFDNWNG